MDPVPKPSTDPELSEKSYPDPEIIFLAHTHWLKHIKENKTANMQHDTFFCGELWDMFRLAAPVTSVSEPESELLEP